MKILREETGDQDRELTDEEKKEAEARLKKVAKKPQAKTEEAPKRTLLLG